MLAFCKIYFFLLFRKWISNGYHSIASAANGMTAEDSCLLPCSLHFKTVPSFGSATQFLPCLFPQNVTVVLMLQNGWVCIVWKKVSTLRMSCRLFHLSWHPRLTYYLGRTTLKVCAVQKKKEHWDAAVTKFDLNGWRELYLEALSLFNKLTRVVTYFL